MRTKPQAWFFGTEPPTPVAPWGQGGPSRKMLLGLGVGLLVLIVGGGGAFAAVTGSSGGSTSAGYAGSGLPAYTANDGNDNGDGSVLGGGATSPPTPPTSSSDQFPDFISAPASSGAAVIGLADTGHLAVRENLTLVGGGIQVGSLDGTLSADGNDLTGPMSGCGSQPVDLRKQQLLSGSQDPLQAAPLTNSGCTIPIVTDLAALNISSQDGTAVVEIDGTPKLTLTPSGSSKTPSTGN